MPTPTRHAIHTSLLACTLLLSACGKPVETPVATVVAPAAAPTPRVVEQLFTHEVIGMNLAYVDKLAGPAVRSEFHRHLYRVDGCEMTLRSDNADKAVQAVEVAITPSCKLSLEPLLGSMAGEKPAQLQDLTFDRFDNMLGGSSYYAECLSMCGNAADPTVALHVEGPRALQFMEFAIEVPLADDATLQAADKWRSAMQAAESEDYVVDTRFNCEPQRFRQVAAPAFDPIKPTVFIFGNNLGYNASNCA